MTEQGLKRKLEKLEARMEFFRGGMEASGVPRQRLRGLSDKKEAGRGSRYADCNAGCAASERLS